MRLWKIGINACHSGGRVKQARRCSNKRNGEHVMLSNESKRHHTNTQMTKNSKSMIFMVRNERYNKTKPIVSSLSHFNISATRNLCGECGRSTCLLRRHQ